MALLTVKPERIVARDLNAVFAIEEKSLCNKSIPKGFQDGKCTAGKMVCWHELSLLKTWQDGSL